MTSMLQRVRRRLELKDDARDALAAQTKVGWVQSGRHLLLVLVSFMALYAVLIALYVVVR